MIKMSFNLYDRDYELADKNALDFSHKAILYNHEDLNKLVIAGREKLNHFITKSIMFYILSELNHDLVTECNILGVGRIDLYDISTRTIYEFESSTSINKRRKDIEIYEQTGVEVIVICLKDLPDDIFQRYLKLREYVVVD
jgi:hypothetical protein